MYPATTGRPPCAPRALFKMSLLQHGYGLSDPQCEELVAASPARPLTRRCSRAGPAGGVQPRALAGGRRAQRAAGGGAGPGRPGRALPGRREGPLRRRHHGAREGGGTRRNERRRRTPKAPAKPRKGQSETRGCGWVGPAPRACRRDRGPRPARGGAERQEKQAAGHRASPSLASAHGHRRRRRHGPQSAHSKNVALKHLVDRRAAGRTASAPRLPLDRTSRRRHVSAAGC
ncbi:MAG: transposase [Limisphaerales bacterium]